MQLLDSYTWIPQGSILGPILFSALINGLHLSIKKTDICNFAYDTTLNVFGKDLDNISNGLEPEINTAIQ